MAQDNLLAQTLYARYRQREPNPGVCQVMAIDWDMRRLTMRNAGCRYYPSFDEIEMVDMSVAAPVPALRQLRVACLMLKRHDAVARTDTFTQIISWNECSTDDEVVAQAREHASVHRPDFDVVMVTTACIDRASREASGEILELCEQLKRLLATKGGGAL